MNLSQNNAFTIGYGISREPVKQTPYKKQLSRMETAKAKRDFVLRNVRNGIVIGTQEENDRSKRIAERHLRG